MTSEVRCKVCGQKLHRWHDRWRHSRTAAPTGIPVDHMAEPVEATEYDDDDPYNLGDLRDLDDRDDPTS